MYKMLTISTLKHDIENHTSGSFGLDLRIRRKCGRFAQPLCMCKIRNMNTLIRGYLAGIGRKGGAAGRGTATRRAVARKAAAARWAKGVDVVGGPVVEITSNGPSLSISPFPEDLLNQLRHFRRFRENGGIGGEWQDLFTLESKTRLVTSTGFYTRINAFLRAKGFEVRYQRLDPQYPEPQDGPLVREGLTAEQQQWVSRMLQVPGGAVLRTQPGDTLAIITALVKAIANSDNQGFIVAEERNVAELIQDHLQEKVGRPEKRDFKPTPEQMRNGINLASELARPARRKPKTDPGRFSIGIGTLVGNNPDLDDVVVTTAALLGDRNLRPDGTSFLIFVDPPRKGTAFLDRITEFYRATKFALCNAGTKYPNGQRNQIEGIFGPTVN
jgi:hypothetical protein